MGILSRKSFARGWVPSADAVNGPADGWLRMDNCVLDQQGVVALRAGSAKINGSALADTDCHSLYTAYLNGTRYRMTGASNAVYANGTSIKGSLAGSNDVAFGSYLGQIFFGRSTSKWKYDGTTVNPWGVTAPNAAVTADKVAPDSKTFASCDSTESPAVSLVEGDAGAFAVGQDGTANHAYGVQPAAVNGRAIAKKVFASPVDFTVYDAGQVGCDEDLVTMWLYVTEPQYLAAVELQIDVNDDTLQDYYAAYLPTGESWSVVPDTDEFLDTDYTVEGDDRADVRARREMRHNLRESQVSWRGNTTAGWNLIQVPRGQFKRYGSTPLTGWNTVKSVRMMTYAVQNGAPAAVRFDELKIVGGGQRTIVGKVKYRLVAVHNSGTTTGYNALSAPNVASAEYDFESNAVTVTVPSGVVSALDAHVNELWLYRMGGTLDAFYRVAVLTGGPFTGAQTITDATSDRAALIANLRMETTATTPPSTPVGIVGPHYDRLFALTATHIYPSLPRNPDSYDSLQAVRVGDASETAYWVAKVREQLYVGTSKDIYRFDGDWTKRPDNVVNVSKRPMGVAQPPVSAAYCQDGDLLIYLASDGWRVLGQDLPITGGEVDLLYKGQTRHGVSGVNLTTGRFRAAVGKGGVFTAITPEGASTTSSAVLHRYAAPIQRWYRHTYGSQAWRAIHREPDGTLIASDTAGFVWTLDTGTQDASSDIAVTLWTVVDDNGQPHQRKDGWEIRARADTGNAAFTAALHLDGSGSASGTSLSVQQNGVGISAASLAALAVYRQVQLRITGSASTFAWYDHQIAYQERPALLLYAEPKPDTRGQRRKRFAGVSVTLDTLNAAATVTPVIDDVDQAAQTVTTNDVVTTVLTLANVVGRDLWVKVAKATGFEFYGADPVIVSECPPLVRGQLPDTNGGYPFRKRIMGVRLRACTLGVQRTFTPYVDGVALATFTATTAANEPDDIISYFATQQIGTDVSVSVDGNLEVYEPLSPLVQQQFPAPIVGRVPDTNGGYPFRKRIIGLRIRACTLGATRTFTPMVDGTSLPTFTATTDANEPDEILHYFATQQVGTDVAFSVDGTIEPYGFEPIVQQQFPQPVKGRVADSNAGTPRPKIVTGIRLRACTLGVARSITPIVDGVSLTAFSATTSSQEPDDLIHSFSAPQTATDIAFSVDGNVEVYDWAPIVDAVLPIGRTLWDSGPIDLGTRAAWVPRLTLKAKLTGNVTVTPYIDDAAQTAVTVTAQSANPITPYDVPLSRAVRGRQVRFVLSASDMFYPYWIEPQFRVTGDQTDLKRTRIEVGA